MFKQNKVSQAIWPWTTKIKTSNTTPFTLKSAVIGLLIGCFAASLFFYLEHWVMAGFVGIITGTLFASALFFPSLYIQIRSSLNTFSFWVGQCLTWLLFVPFFYLFFPLARIAQRLLGKDPLCCIFSTDLPSYWINRKGNRKPEQYTRQF